MKHLRTEIVIAAPVETVWATLTDFASYPNWNPLITSLEGDISEGGKVEASILGMTIKPRIQRLDANSELRWLGHAGVPGLFDGEHYFRLESRGEGSTRFVHGERFSGLLIPIFGIIGLFGRTERGFIAMNEALKARAEGKKNKSKS